MLGLWSRPRGVLKDGMLTVWFAAGHFRKFQGEHWVKKDFCKPVPPPRQN